LSYSDLRYSVLKFLGPFEVWNLVLDLLLGGLGFVGLGLVAHHPHKLQASLAVVVLALTLLYDYY
jgi:hypothetical protein